MLLLLSLLLKKNNIARDKTFNNLNTFNNLKVLEMGPLRFRKGEIKVIFTRP